MLNRFLNQDTRAESAKKTGITDLDAKNVLELLEAYSKHQLNSLSYKDRKKFLSVSIHATSPNVEKISLSPYPSLPVVPVIEQDADWEPIDIEEVAPANVQEAQKITGIAVHAHMSGSVYLKPNPTSSDFVSQGTAVQLGDVLCILEAMKLFSELKAPSNGVISRIFVNHGDIVKEGDVLFEITV